MEEEKKGGRAIYARITEEIVAAISVGAPSYEMPWHRSGPNLARPTNVASCQGYRGVNVLALWVAAERCGYPNGHWATYRQWATLNAQVRKGERGVPIIFYKEVESAEKDDDGERGRRLIARTSYVFNAAQVDGWEVPSSSRTNLVERIGHAELFVQSTGARVDENRGRACYLPSLDRIEMPAREEFVPTTTSTATEAYYATLFHELTHWTGHDRRLDRKLANRFGDEAYAMEELVAELGAAFLCADQEISNAPRLDHAAYLGTWLKVLKNDDRAIFTAASKASAAADYLHAQSAAALARLQNEKSE